MIKTICQTKKCYYKLPPLLANENNNEIVLLAKNHMIMTMHKILFKHYGYKVVSINNPEKLCNYLMSYRPSLVVIDMEIRQKLCKKIGDFLKVNKIPTLLIITTGQECDVCQYLEPEMCDYVDMVEEELKLIIFKAERLMKKKMKKIEKPILNIN